MNEERQFLNDRKSERGAALPTVLLISLLLMTASAAMLSAVGANSRNTSDVLAETKAYYAAESGLQRAVNVLRNNPNATYSWALSNQWLGMTTTTVNGVQQVTTGTEAGFSLAISDPDHTSTSETFNTVGWFSAALGTVIDQSGKRACVPDCNAAAHTEILFTDAPSTTYNFSGSNPSIGTFTVTKVGGGAAIANKIDFQIDYKLTLPRSATRTIRGNINTSTAANPVTVNFLTEEYILLGSQIELCSATTQNPGQLNACTNLTTWSLIDGGAKTLNAYITPIEPYRLQVSSTGYAPNGAQKKLEAILQKNFLNDLPSSSGLTMVGPGANLNFAPGPGSPTYCGVDPGIQPGQTIPNNPSCTVDPNKPSAPSIGVTDQTGLDRVKAAAGNTEIVPPPAVITDGPDWQSSAQSMNDFVNKLRVTAQTSGRYIPSHTGGNSFQNAQQGAPYINSSEYLTGQGVTFCEGNCSVGPLSGGGILVVTGNFAYNGNFNFRGMILVVGPPGTGVTRSGAGSGVILGNMVIAPYDPTNLAAGFGSPSFSTTGGGTSDLIFSGLSVEFDGTSAISNFMLGVAEK